MALLTGIIILAVMRISNLDLVIFVGSLMVIVLSLGTYLASVKRRRRDRRIAGG
ncbi:hypothetical protein [Kitasatospora mediocidica]|uniref:hypothetical protein n=1 Tax=Kitasatospora mediocidica TaxID=58352 RepID=UPI0012F958B5|nr:hypothetical protein [Kitasatospora mediocidica]